MLPELSNQKFTWRSWLFLTAFIVANVLMIFQKPKNSIFSDASGYYCYLPAVFIHQSFAFDAIDCKRTEDGRIFTKFSSGVAIMESPFFLLGHLYAKASDQYEDNGYSEPYHAAIRYGALFYCTTAFIMFAFLLRRYFKEHIVILTLLGVYFGTNLYFYTIYASGSAHIYNFFMFTCVLVLSDSLYRNYKFWKVTLIAFIFGLISLTRPTNAIVIFLIVFYEVYNIQHVKERFQFWFSKWKHVLLASPLVFLPWIPQLFYWKALKGSWFIYSYGKEGFPYWRGEKILLVLFDVQGGLFLYSPLVLLMVIGTIMCIRKKIFSGPVALLIFALATYTFASWWYWWFGGSFGHRCFVDIYPVLVLPFAYFLTRIEMSNKWLKYSMLALVILMVYISGGLTISYDPPWDGKEWGWDDYWQRIKILFTERYW